MLRPRRAQSKYSDPTECSSLNAMERASCPRECDILCGKDKKYAKHSGNRLFREHIEATRFAYKAAETKQEKMKITRNIVSYFKEQMHARFLKPVGNDQWVEIRDTTARDKVSHALRFSVRNNDSDNSTCKNDDSSSQKSSASTTSKKNKSNRHRRTNSCNGSFLPSAVGMSVSTFASNKGGQHKESKSVIGGEYKTIQMSLGNDVVSLHTNCANSTISSGGREEGQYHEWICTWGPDMMAPTTTNRMIALLDSTLLLTSTMSCWMEGTTVPSAATSSPTIQSNDEASVSVDEFKEMTATLQSEELDAMLQEPLILDEWESSMARV